VVVEAEHRDARAQDVHDVGVLGRVGEEIDHRRGQGAGGAEVGLEFFEFGLVGEAFMPEEVDDFLVADLAGEFVDVVPGVDEDALVPQHITEAGGGGDDSFKSGRGDGHTLHLTRPVPLCHPKRQKRSFFKLAREGSKPGLWPKLGLSGLREILESPLKAVILRA
jgi:hypothetical protein